MAVDQHLQPGEEILYRAHPSRFPLIPPLVAAGIVIVAAVVLSQKTGPDNRLLVAIGAGIPLLFLLGVAGVRYLRLISREYFLTNQRLIQQEGLLAKRSIESYLGKINNIEHSQSFWGRLLGYGDLRIDTANADDPSVFPNIADPLGFKRAISGAAAAIASGARFTAAPTLAAPPAASGADRMRQLKSLLDDGLITQAEFDAKRKQLLEEI
jgi:hypothetical protein